MGNLIRETLNKSDFVVMGSQKMSLYMSFICGIDTFRKYSVTQERAFPYRIVPRIAATLPGQHVPWGER